MSYNSLLGDNYKTIVCKRDWRFDYNSMGCHYNRDIRRSWMEINSFKDNKQ